MAQRVSSKASEDFSRSVIESAPNNNQAMANVGIKRKKKRYKSGRWEE